MKLKWLIWPSLAVLLTVVVIGIYRSRDSQDVPIIALSEENLVQIGQDPANWTQDLETIRALFASIAPVDESLSATEQVASIPPELTILGAGLEQMRQLASQDRAKGEELATILDHEAQRSELFLPIRALAYTHLVILAKDGQVKIDESKYPAEVKALAAVVLSEEKP